MHIHGTLISSIPMALHEISIADIRRKATRVNSIIYFSHSDYKLCRSMAAGRLASSATKHADAIRRMFVVGVEISETVELARNVADIRIE